MSASATQVAEVIVLLLVVGVALASLARKIGLPEPVLLVAAGVAVSFVPGMPSIPLEPELVLLVFVGPLLYVDGYFAPVRELRRNAVSIGLLASVLVVATAAGVAVVAHYAIGMDWAIAFALGAALSATDALAPAQVLESESADPRLLAVVRGESLLNDGVAFALVAVAGTAAAAEEFNAAKGLLELVIYIVGGVLVGLLVAVADRQAALALDVHPDRGRAVAADPLRRLPGRRGGARLGHPGRRGRRPVGGPPLARVRRSPGPDRDPGRLARGRLRAQFAPLHARRATDPRHHRHRRPAHGPRPADRRGRHRGRDRDPAAVGADHRPRLARDRAQGRAGTCARRRRGRSASCWAGAACAARSRWPPRWPFPISLDAGGPLPGRELAIVLALFVIVATLLIQGLTLRPLVRRMGLTDPGAVEREKRLALQTASEVALKKLPEAAERNGLHEEERHWLEREYELRNLRAADDDADADEADDVLEAAAATDGELLSAAREAVLELEGEGEVRSDVAQEVIRRLDLSSARLRH